MRVYRIEKPGIYRFPRGPFGDETYAAIAQRDRSSGREHAWQRHSLPSPWNDGIDAIDASIGYADRSGVNWHCATTSLSQLRRWFNRYERGQLSALGYETVAYDVPDNAVRKGRTQCIFDAREAVRAATYDMDTLKEQTK